ncbi:6-carboxy-5,6,7,8-tetrahydropterin synthase [Bryobacterales bacterium F-183]|nr:6-carboxy-5,6,7,8-tetrahydropterin synthase [Bryobacterales bacterium F-183]
MFEVSVEAGFAAAHQLRNYRGKCENLHGHNYKVQVTVEGEDLNSIGLLADFTELKGALREITEFLDHKFLNEIEPFTEINPSAENVAKYIADRLQAQLDSGTSEVPVFIAAVKVWETDTSTATYRPKR